MAQLNMALTERQKIVLAALAADKGASFAPVQVQKLFFLIDSKVAADLGGKQFDFQPYDYGPFDAAVYCELETLQRNGYVTIERVDNTQGRRRYGLTIKGQEKGEEVLEGLPRAAAKFMSKVSSWVLSLSFAELVGSIYKAFPEMKVNSVFKD